MTAKGDCFCALFLTLWLLVLSIVDVGLDYAVFVEMATTLRETDAASGIHIACLCFAVIGTVLPLGMWGLHGVCVWSANSRSSPAVSTRRGPTGQE